MKLILNGELQSLKEVKTIPDLLRVLGLDSTKVAIELNLEIVPKSLYAATHLSDSDRIEIVEFVGGG